MLPQALFPPLFSHTPYSSLLSPGKIGRELGLASAFFWERNKGLFVVTAALHVASGGLDLASRPGASPGAAALAGAAFSAAKLAALALFLERTKVVKVRAGESILWRCFHTEGRFKFD